MLKWCSTPHESEPSRLRRFGPLAPDTREFLVSRGIDSLYALACGDDDRQQALYNAAWRQQLTVWREGVRGLRQAGVRTLTFKGAELICRHFEDSALGFTADLDVLVPRDQIERARAALYQQGFRHAYLDRELSVLRDRDLRDVAEIELKHYELAPFVKTVPLDVEHLSVHDLSHGPIYLDAGRPTLIVEVDLHHNVAMDADAEMFFSRAVESSLGLGETFSSADHVWFNLSRHYNEVGLHGSTSLKPLAYTLPEIVSGRVDWEVVERVSEQLALGPTLYYFLAFCDRVAGGHIPPSTLDAVRASTESRIRDWGWQLASLFDFEEEFPAHAFAESAFSELRPSGATV